MNINSNTKQLIKEIIDYATPNLLEQLSTQPETLCNLEGAELEQLQEQVKELLS